MNEARDPANSMKTFSDADFDRLVDGELSPPEYRQLLASLDDRPDGWKRLGCAFLEGQAWRQDLAPARSAAPAPVVPRQQWWMRPSPQWLALAASLMLVFALGTQIDRAWNAASPPPGSSLVQSNQAGIIPLSGAKVPAMSPSALSNLSVVVNHANGAAESTYLPVFDGQNIDPQQVWKFSDSVPEDVIKNLEASGKQMVSQRHLVPVHLEDGRTIVVPVEHIQVVPRTY